MNKERTSMDKSKTTISELEDSLKEDSSKKLRILPDGSVIDEILEPIPNEGETVKQSITLDPETGVYHYKVNDDMNLKLVMESAMDCSVNILESQLAEARKEVERLRKGLKIIEHWGYTDILHYCNQEGLGVRPPTGMELMQKIARHLITPQPKDGTE